MTSQTQQRSELYVTREIRVPMSEIRFTFVRSSGPGGQNVNKVNSKACMRWNVAESDAIQESVKQRFTETCRRRINQNGEFLIESQRFRDQGRNVTDCLNKLAELLLDASKPPRKRRPTRPSRASRERRLSDKKKRSDRKRLRKRLNIDD